MERYQNSSKLVRIKKLKLNPDMASYVPVKMVNNEEMYSLVINIASSITC